MGFTSSRTGPVSPRRSAELRKQFVQAEVVLPELAAVVPSRDLENARAARGIHAGSQRALDGRTIQTIHHDLEHGIHALWQLAAHALPAAQCRTVRVVGGRDHVLVLLRPDLAAGADDAAGK